MMTVPDCRSRELAYMDTSFAHAGAAPGLKAATRPSKALEAQRDCPTTALDRSGLQLPRRSSGLRQAAQTSCPDAI